MPRLSTILWLLFWGFIAWFIIKNPAGAAHTVNHIGSGLSSAASGVSTFLSSL
jgi:hypothetical protein